MRWKQWVAKVAIYAILELGALLGVPMRPDQIVEMTRLMQKAVPEESRREEDPSGDPPDPSDPNDPIER